jgi:hypothetical protein
MPLNLCAGSFLTEDLWEPLILRFFRVPSSINGCLIGGGAFAHPRVTFSTSTKGALSKLLILIEKQPSAGSVCTKLSHSVEWRVQFLADNQPTLIVKTIEATLMNVRTRAAARFQN